MGVVRRAEGAQECQVLLEFGQGRAVSKSLLDQACVNVLGSHGHHLRGIERVRERGPPEPRARRGAIRVAISSTSKRRMARAERPGLGPHRLAQRVPTGCMEAVISLFLVDCSRMVRTRATR